MSAPAAPTQTAREYLRVSVDRSGREKSQSEQHDENRAAAPVLGIDRWGKPYKDTGSASRYARKARDDFPQLLRDLTSGTFGADVLVLWESSRGSRKVGEWCQLIEACEEGGVRIAVTTHGRSYDPANARDRRSMQEDAVDSEYESAKTSARRKRSAAADAAAGLPHGKVPFGYTRTYDPRTRRLIAQELHPTEAPIVVELFDRLAAGHSLTTIAKDFTARGITSRKGVPFVPQALRKLALAPVYRGQRVHSPGRGTSVDDAEFTYEAQWPAMVSDDVFLAVRARLKDPSRVTTRPGRAKHLLSMTARCDVCGGPLSARDRHGARRYWCRDVGCVTIVADVLDAWAEDQIVSLLTRPDVLERLLPHGVDDADMAEARDEVARVKAEHRDLIAKVGAGKLSATLAAGAEPGILARLALAETKLSDLGTPTELRQLIEPGPKVAKQWTAMPMEAKREVVKLLFARNVLGVLSVAPVNGGKNMVKARVRLDGQPLADSG